MTDREHDDSDKIGPPAGADAETRGVLRDLGVVEQITLSPPASAPLRATWNAEGATIGQVPPGTAPDAADFDSFYMRHWPGLLRAMIRCCRYDRDLAEDITQQTFLIAYRRRDRLSEVANHEAWLHAVARNTATKYFRRRQAEENLIRTMAAGVSGNPWPGFDTALNDLLTRVLTDRQRRIIIYRYLEDQPLQSIAERMNLSKRTINYEIRKSLDLIRPYLEPGQEDS
ncbi:RNA polymerase sigma factor [Micromonospora sp. RL09-050-HVF-A]|uniref:RNA polymerase sigma factor n=1 Tax=Micromonospora sp. RL09-050-HVF-A TaxID=1703433 RepID=UPI001C5ED753|nr:sigma-70 family RNA polymerase sigma factor [Micromonospora sp. RL09-050-HVF-A]MBW4705201.1 sigma-70 family RNA polymerase sigma factor [Micromonospora sp. RL09-050-HVF-A]